MEKRKPEHLMLSSDVDLRTLLTRPPRSSSSSSSRCRRFRRWLRRSLALLELSLDVADDDVKDDVDSEVGIPPALPPRPPPPPPPPPPPLSLYSPLSGAFGAAAAAAAATCWPTGSRRHCRQDARLSCQRVSCAGGSRERDITRGEFWPGDGFERRIDDLPLSRVLKHGGWFWVTCAAWSFCIVNSHDNMRVCLNSEKDITSTKLFRMSMREWQDD